MKIAVIGGGISGLSAAYALSTKHQVTLFEKETRIGGHSHTIDVRFGKRKIPVDTGFMVYSPPRYPHLTALFKHLSVQSIPTTMLFSVSLDDGSFEFSSAIPNGIFADRSNLISVSFYKFLLEIRRFNRTARKALKDGISDKITLKAFLKRHKFSRDLERKYLLPTVGSIWSTPRKLARDFPALALFKFLDNHELLTQSSHPHWRTLRGGSVVYVKKVARRIRLNGGTILCNARARIVSRNDKEVIIVSNGKRIHFDYVIVATHADEAVHIIDHPTKKERHVLSQFKYEKNSVIVHSDPRLMPSRKNAWAAWNYRGKSIDNRRPEKVRLTYWMNVLQSINKKFPIFVTLNPYMAPRNNLVHARLHYSHPLYSVQSMKAQKELTSIQGNKRTLFCGSYFGYGFHEDGIASAIAVARYFGVKPPWK